MTVPELEELHVGDVGAELGVIVTENGVALDVSGAVTTQKFKFQLPISRTIKEATFTFKTNGTDGHLIYVTTDDDFLSEAGVWTGQVQLGPVGVWTGHTSKWTFQVHENF